MRLLDVRSMCVGSLVLATLAAGCDGEQHTLTVRLQSGLRAGLELREAQVTLFPGGACGGPDGRALVAFGVDEDAQARLSAGTLTVGEIRVAAGVWSVLVRADVARRSVRRCVVVNVRADRVVRVPLTVDCLDVECPAPAGAPSFTECLNGRCVDPRCDPDDPSTVTYCCDRSLLGATCDEDPTWCVAADDCEAALACASPVCERGVCVEPPVGACGPGAYCSVEHGQCEPISPSSDAGLADAPTMDAATTELDAPMLDAPMLDAPMLDAPMLDALGADAYEDDAVDVFVAEDCTLRGDEDGRNGADCADPSCATHPVCTVSGCAPVVLPTVPADDIPAPTHWFRSDVGLITSVRGEVCAWRDLVGGAHFAASRPTLPVRGLVGSMPSVLLDADAAMQAGSDLAIGPDGGYSLFLVTRVDRAGSGDPVLETGATGPATVFFRTTQETLPGDNLLFGVAFASPDGLSTYAMPRDRTSPLPNVQSILVGDVRTASTLTSVIEYRRDGSARALTLDAGSGTGGPVAAPGTPQAVLGGGTASGLDVLELLVYGRLLTPAERTRVESYLSTRY